MDNIEQQMRMVSDAYTPGQYIKHNMVLGSLLAYENFYLSFFKMCNIKHIVSLKPIPLDKHQVLVEHGIDVHVINCPHRVFKERYNYVLNVTNEIVKQAKMENVNVFINCRSGQHRSVAIVASILMIMENATYNDAYQFIKDRRSCVEMNYMVNVREQRVYSDRITVGDLYLM